MHLRNYIVVFIFALSLSSSSFGQKYMLVNIRQFPNDTANFGDFQWSSNAKYIAMQGGNPEGLYIYNVDSISFRRIADRPMTGHTVWSLDCKYIAFGSHTGEAANKLLNSDKIEVLKIFKLNSGHTIEVARDVRLFGHFIWDQSNILRLYLPGLEVRTEYFDTTGKKLTHDKVKKEERIRPDEHLRLYRVNDDGTDKKYITGPGRYFGVFMTANGSKVVTMSSHGYFLVIDLITSSIDSFKVRGDIYSVSRDGRLILYESSVNGGHDGQAEISSDIYIIESNGKHNTRLTFEPTRLYHLPRISPDNRHIIFKSFQTQKSYIADLKITSE